MRRGEGSAAHLRHTAHDFVTSKTLGKIDGRREDEFSCGLQCAKKQPSRQVTFRRFDDGGARLRRTECCRGASALAPETLFLDA